MIYFIGQSDLIESDIYKKSTIEECLEYFKDKDIVACDTETKGRDCHSKPIICLQIGDSDNQWVIDTRVTDIKSFKSLLESKLVIFHNAKFDYKFLKKAGIIVENIYDTMLAECVIYCGYDKFGYSLKDVAMRYLNIDLDKTTRGDFFKLESQPFTDKQIEYAALDVTYLHKIREKQLEFIKKYDLEYCLNLENNVVKALADIEYNGMYLNSEKWKNNSINYNSEMVELIKQLDEVVENESKLTKFVPKYVQANLFGFEERVLEINYSSPSQIKNMFAALGYTVDSTNDRELSKLTSKHKFFELLSKYREVSKVVSTYGEGFLNYINKTTGRIHTDFWQIKSTGRIASGSKDMNSPNMQNIPADNKFRNCFEARKGYKLVSIDYSGQELALMADRSGEVVFIEALNNKEDLHCKSASLLYGKTITKADKKERTAAKTITFGLCYGMGINKLSDQLSISKQEAEDLFNKYSKAFPTLMSWLDASGKNAKVNFRSVTQDLCKRIRWYPDMKKALELRQEESDDWKTIFTIEGSTEREGKNHLIQGSGANITKEALVDVRTLINSKYKDKAFLICTVHDQIDVEVENSIAEQFAKEMAEVMINAGNKYLSKVKIEVDTTITDCWTK